MSYRPYPDPERARRQLDRHRRPAVPLTELQRQMATSARTVLEHAERQMRPFGEAMRQWAAAAAVTVQRETSLTSQLRKMLKERAAAS
ncbi:hypothetical protein ABTZ58_03740 [Streptomyces sp. NPDC094143]|jgi:hypothetical protein|uniref:hypothetical protein n=1 Tax=unclassified Streptomyces TaxID=2593676 RepID=UPI003322B184